MANEEYECKVYATASFYVKDGMYSIEELELILCSAKELKKHQDKALERGMQHV
jgi:hypothetical protein